MKSTLILFSILIATGTTAIGQNNELKKEQIQSIQKLINAFNTKNKSKIADLISYPLRREYPLKDVKAIMISSNALTTYLIKDFWNM